MVSGIFLGNYNKRTLIKGIAYPFFINIARLSGLGYGVFFTIVFIVSCVYFTFSLKKIIKNNTLLILILILLLFNPISYSSDLFQRLYRNCLSYIELLFFLGTVINIIASKKNNILNYIFLGIIVSIMFLTKEDTIWAKLILILIIILKLYKNLSIKNVLINLIPVLVIVLNLNIMSYINYKNYNIYTYNELTDSYFKDAYVKILQIKDNEKIEQVAIPKSTFYKLAENSKVFDFSKEEIDRIFKLYPTKNGEIINSNIIWIFRSIIYEKYNFKDGKQANEYFYKLSKELDELFKEGKLEKEFAFSSVFMNPPSINDIKQLPKNLIKAIIYTSTYKNIRTFPNEKMKKVFAWDDIVDAYKMNYYNSHNIANIIEENILINEIIRQIYKFFTIVFSIVSLIIYVKNIRTKDTLNMLLHIVLFIYLIVLCGVTYTHTTGFDAIRYCYLGNIYILQTIFIMLNLYRITKKNSVKLIESGAKNDFSNNSSI